MKVQLLVSFLSLTLWCCPMVEAESCKDGKPLLELVTTSDAIAVLKKSRFLGGVHPQGYAIRGFQFTFDEFVKHPLIDGFDIKKQQSLRHETKLLRVRDDRKKYFAFMRYVSPNVWTVVPCGLLTIAPDNDVEDACTRVSDLYGKNRFVRERRCLLSMWGCRRFAVRLKTRCSTIRAFAALAILFRPILGTRIRISNGFYFVSMVDREKSYSRG